MILKYSMLSISIFLFLISTSFGQMVTCGKDGDEKAYVEAGLSGTYNKMFTENTVGTSSTPIKVYVALDRDGTQQNYVRFTAPNHLSMPSVTASSSSTIKVSLDAHKSDSYDYRLYAAVQPGANSNWNVLPTPPSPNEELTTNDATKSYTYSLTLSTIYEKAGIALNSSSENNQKINVFFFLKNSDEGWPTDIVPSSFAGIYYQIMINDVLPVNTMYLDDLKKGDERLKAVFRDGTQVTQMDSSVAYKTLAIKRGDIGAQLAGTIYRDAITAGGEVVMEVDPVREGYLDIKNLQNRTETTLNDYNISVAMENKYHFVSKLSNSEVESPEKLETLLNKQACFIVTAGFGEEHYVIDYFREFRDEFLLTNFLGQKFVGLYYAYSPKYAKMIYKNENARWTVRMVSYCVYYFMNYFLEIILVLGLSILAHKKYRKVKIGAQQT